MSSVERRVRGDNETSETIAIDKRVGSSAVYSQFSPMRRRVVYVMLALCGLLFAGLAGWLLVSMNAWADAAVPMSTVTVDLADGQGAVRGNFGQTTWTGQSFVQFRGIPFAEAPIGDLRFRVG